MAVSEIITILIALIVGMLGYFLSRLSDNVRDIEKSMAELPKEYVLKSEYRDDIDDIKGTLKDIFKILRQHEKDRITD
jgi:Tfp pilus assembly protein PilO